jgi:hypothetical protein
MMAVMMAAFELQSMSVSSMLERYSMHSSVRGHGLGGPKLIDSMEISSFAYKSMLLISSNTYLSKNRSLRRG